MSVKQKGINLLPKKYIQEAKFSVYRKIGLVALSVEIIVFISCVVLPCKVKVYNTSKEVEAREIALNSPKYEGVNKTLEELKSVKEVMKGLEGEAHLLKKERYISGDLLDELMARLPQGITIENISVQDSQGQEINDINEAKAAEEAQMAEGAEVTPITRSVDLKGKAIDTFSVVAYVASLETLFEDKNIDYKLETEGTYVGFTVTIQDIQTKRPLQEETVEEENIEEETSSSEEVEDTSLTQEDAKQKLEQESGEGEEE